jgi:hypothetical protein
MKRKKANPQCYSHVLLLTTLSFKTIQQHVHTKDGQLGLIIWRSVAPDGHYMHLSKEAVLLLIILSKEYCLGDTVSPSEFAICGPVFFRFRVYTQRQRSPWCFTINNFSPSKFY